MLVSACVGGAATVEETEKDLRSAGFTDINISNKKVDEETVRDLASAGISDALDYVISASIEAVKPGW
jgi:molybdenum cofactor biosynthesis enzyme MoaA